jgi:hypothetical protein
MTKLIKFFLVFSSVLGVVRAQSTIVAESTSGQTPLQPHAALVAFMASNSNTTAELVKNSALGGVETRAMSAVVGQTLPIPVVGGVLSEIGVGKIMHAFHRDKPIPGFQIAYLQGLSASTILPRGEFRFTIPADALQGGRPALLRVKAMSKDSARIVRGVHAVVVPKKSQINPMANDTKILGIDEDSIPFNQEVRNGQVVITLKSVLESGEYAVAIVQVEPTALPLQGSYVWDFRVM